MKNFLVSLALVLFLSGPASAITVGGVTWDPDSILDFSSFSIAIHQDIDEVTGIVSGYGSITTMNGTDASIFVSGGELTFTYGGFVPADTGALPGSVGSAITYTDGWVNIYVDDEIEITNPSNPTTLTLANTSNGDLWLSMVGHEYLGATLTGSVVLGGLSGLGQLDVTGGLAMENFDTDSVTDGADLTFSNSFTMFLTGSLLNANGTGNYFGDSISTVPEPAAVLLFGIGLIGIAGMGRKKLFL